MHSLCCRQLSPPLQETEEQVFVGLLVRAALQYRCEKTWDFVYTVPSRTEPESGRSVPDRMERTR
jgi:hypothetical protein